MPLFIVNEEINQLKVDVIVNVDKGTKADVSIDEDCLYRVEKLSKGESRIKQGYNKSCQYVIHTKGLRALDTANALRSVKQSYLSLLNLTIEKKCSSIALPLLINEKDASIRDMVIENTIAIIREYLTFHELDVHLVLSKPYLPSRLNSVFKQLRHLLVIDEPVMMRKSVSMDRMHDQVEHYAINKVIAIDAEFQTFQERLFELIDKNDYKETDVYKRANISRKLFSKIRSDRLHIPKKSTVIALVFALRLEIDEAIELLQSAGYYLAEGIEYDRIIRFFLEKHIYDVIDINISLYEYGYKPLGSK